MGQGGVIRAILVKGIMGNTLVKLFLKGRSHPIENLHRVLPTHGFL